MILYIVRHAWAEERDADVCPDDDLRPLTNKGKKRFFKLAARLAEGQFRPKLIATSPLIRCRQSADLILDRLDGGARLIDVDALRPHGDLDTLLSWTAEQPETEIAWVGHEPDVSAFVSALIGSGQTQINFAKGAAAAIEFDGHPERGAGALLWFATAKLFGL